MSDFELSIEPTLWTTSGHALDQKRVIIDHFVYSLQSYPFHTIGDPIAYEWHHVEEKHILQWIQTWDNSQAPALLKAISLDNDKQGNRKYTVRLLNYGKGTQLRLAQFILHAQKYQRDEDIPIQPFDIDISSTTSLDDGLLVLKILDIYEGKRLKLSTVPHWGLYI